MEPFTQKTGRTLGFFLALCGVCLWVSNRWQLAWCGEWRHAALREIVHTAPDADVVFLGSSRTSRGIIPKVFDEKYRELSGGEALASVNLGIMGTSRQISYEVLRAWLERHSAPEIVFLETSETDLIQWVHKLLVDMVSPLESVDVMLRRPYRYRDGKHYRREIPLNGEPPFDPGGIFNEFEVVQLNVDQGLRGLGRGPEDLARYVSNRFWNGVDGRGWDNPYRRSEAQPGIPEIVPAVTAAQVQESGWYLIAPKSSDGVHGKARVMERVGDPKRAEAWREERDEDHWEDPSWYRPSRIYLKKVADLCRERGIRLIVVELPEFGAPRLTELQMEVHRQAAELYRPDMEILHRPDFFQDPGHLSTNGARWYSAQLAQYLVDHPR